MKQLVVISGKGGTGKTTVTAALAQLLGPLVLADCDVEAPNLHLLLRPDIEKSFLIQVSRKASIDSRLCDGCGECVKRCRFEAIAESDPLKVDAFRCEGCGVCGLVCPRGAIDYYEPEGAEVYSGLTPYGPMVGARLAVGEEASGKVVTRVRSEAQLISLNIGLPLIMVDGSPGTGCPVIASVSGADLALVVTEPSLSGWHDLERILQVANHFSVQPLVCVNKFDLFPEMSQKIKERCRQEGIEVVAEIPFSSQVVESLRQGKPPLGAVSREVEMPLKNLAKKLERRLGMEKSNPFRSNGETNFPSKSGRADTI